MLDAFAVRNGLRLERPSIPTQVPAESRDSTSMIFIFIIRFLPPQFSLLCLEFMIYEQASTNHSFHTIGRRFLFLFCIFSTLFQHVFQHVFNIFHHFSPLFLSKPPATWGQLFQVKSPAHGSAFTCYGAPICQWATASNLTLNGFNDFFFPPSFTLWPYDRKITLHSCRVFFIYPFNKDSLFEGGIRNRESTLKM